MKLTITHVDDEGVIDEVQFTRPIFEPLELLDSDHVVSEVVLLKKAAQEIGAYVYALEQEMKARMESDGATEYVSTPA